MTLQDNNTEHRGPQGCRACRDGTDPGLAFEYAFQPIVDIHNQQIFAHEALVRGPAGESAFSVLSGVTEENRYRFDQACRVKAIKTAAALNMSSRLSINFMPNAIYRPELCIRTTLQAASEYGFPIERIIFEAVESENIGDGKWLANVLSEYKRIGFLTAIDDFGAGFAGLNLLADFQPDIIKLDMALIRNLDTQPARQTIVRGIARIGEELGIAMIAEGVETLGEYHCLQDMGLHLMQGYLFCRPLFQRQAEAGQLSWPAAKTA